MKNANAVNPEPIIEVSPIRLSVDETKLILNAVVAGKPIPANYHASVLVDMGIFVAIEVPEEKDTAQKIEECWQRAEKAMVVKNGVQVHQAMHDLERLNNDRDRNDTKYLFALTDLGKQIARGISVRLNTQYAAKRGAR